MAEPRGAEVMRPAHRAQLAALMAHPRLAHTRVSNLVASSTLDGPRGMTRLGGAGATAASATPPDRFRLDIPFCLTRIEWHVALYADRGPDFCFGPGDEFLLWDEDGDGVCARRLAEWRQDDPRALALLVVEILDLYRVGGGGNHPRSRHAPPRHHFSLSNCFLYSFASGCNICLYGGE
jgi:hypothetical protein